ncbi:signal peptidase II [Mesomycoplasma ovipneumoniae]|uniref:Signal peptidase II n=1 Tax=Mesomycoplasma ovipneumoniae TaxID=29562 RepID=A0AAJ2P858_9BACT|nr:signal peptidase II [Mesomycoplasma ovipneumoniae]MDW2906265.1 signal peptidase II [Mesomycoplasma ovipneumoniae]MDW2914061.1 signal peptidase II [Mesomycoplasma ovipneumoniae]
MKTKNNTIIKYINSKYIKIGKKRLIINILIAFLVILVTLLIDQLTKNLIFTYEQYRESTDKGFVKTISWGFIGFRPFLHQGVTSGINNVIGFTGIHIFAFLISLILLILIPFSKRYSLTIFMAILLGGNWGNEIDRILDDNHVKDLLFLPFISSSGTFNFADIFIFVGPIGIFIVSLYDQVRPWILKRLKNKIFKKKNKN